MLRPTRIRVTIMKNKIFTFLAALAVSSIFSLQAQSRAAKIWPLILDETTVTQYEQYIAADFRPNDETNFLYNWENTYYAGDATGLNAFGHNEGYVALGVGSMGWSGAGFCLTEAGTSWQQAEALRQAIVANPNDYFLHIAIKSTDNASHCFYLYGNDATRFVLGNRVVYDGTVYQDFERDGKWHEFYIPMTQFANALSNTTAQAGVNVLAFLSEATPGVQLNLDAVYFCTTAMKDMMPAVVNGVIPDPVDPEPQQPGDTLLWPILLDETTVTDYGQYISANFSPNEETNFLYIWEGTYSAREATGLNAFGHTDGYMALSVGSMGWSGLGFCLTEAGTSWQQAETLRQAIVANPNDYFLHIAIKSTDNASHCFYIMGSEATKFVLGNHSVYDGPVYQDFTRDGSWQEFYIPMTQFADALANTTVQAGVNVLIVLSEGTMGVQLNLDAVYFCTKAMKDMMSSVNPQPVEPEEMEVAVNYLDKDIHLIDRDVVTLLLPEVPEFEGFTFLKWEVLAGNLEDGINIQAVYEADELHAMPAVVVNPANSSQKLVREGNVYILKGENIYTVRGQKVR